MENIDSSYTPYDPLILLQMRTYACAPRDVVFKGVPRNIISNSPKLEIVQMLIDNRKKTNSSYYRNSKAKKVTQLHQRHRGFSET